MTQATQPQNIADMIDYQPGSVVSRTLIKKETGTVTLFAFYKDQSLSEHTAPFDAMVHVLHGRAEVTLSGNPMTLSEGQMVILPANEPHALKAIEPFKMALTMIRS